MLHIYIYIYIYNILYTPEIAKVKFHWTIAMPLNIHWEIPATNPLGK